MFQLISLDIEYGQMRICQNGERLWRNRNGDCIACKYIRKVLFPNGLCNHICLGVWVSYRFFSPSQFAPRRKKDCRELYSRRGTDCGVARLGNHMFLRGG